MNLSLLCRGIPVEYVAAGLKGHDVQVMDLILEKGLPERLRRFFARVNGHYQISKAVRELCIFSRHDVSHDPPFSRVDLISCRNVLIYMALSFPVDAREIESKSCLIVICALDAQNTIPFSAE